MVLKARIEKGQIVAEAPPGYEEGQEVDIEILDPHHDLTPEERAELDREIEEGERDFEEGRYAPASEVLADLRRRRE
jgi:hypothetical protein